LACWKHSSTGHLPPATVTIVDRVTARAAGTNTKKKVILSGCSGWRRISTWWQDDSVATHAYW
jgi:hypothetical protein